MLNRLILILSFLGALGCSTDKVDERADDNDRNQTFSALPSNAQFDEKDTIRLREVERLAEQVATSTWPDFADQHLRGVLIDSRNQYAVNIDPMPSYYRSISTEGTWFDSFGITDSYRDENGQRQTLPQFVFQSVPAYFTNGHYKQTILMMLTLSQFHQNGDQMSANEWAVIGVHELFHNYQDTLVPLTDDNASITDGYVAERALASSTHKSKVQTELNLLADAVCSSDDSAARSLLQQAKQARESRWQWVQSQFGDDIKSWERYQIWAEGTATYVERKTQALYESTMSDSLLLDDPHHSTDLRIPQDPCAEIRNIGEYYWYAMGYAQSLLLDRLAPGWKAKAVDTSLFLDAH